MNLKKNFISAIIAFLTVSTILVNSVYALTEAQKKAADINQDGKIDNQDIDLMVQIGYPEAPNSGIARSSGDGNYIFANSFMSVGVIGSDGEFTPGSGEIYGYYTRTFNGTLRTYTMYNQTLVGLPGDCNRVAATSIASAYSTDALERAKNSAAGLGYVSSTTNAYFNEYGLNASVCCYNTLYDNVMYDIVTALSNNRYVMFDLSQAGVVGKSGQKWTSTRHWLALLDIKTTDDGNYAVFVADPGHGGTVADWYGLGCGWYYIDEWEGKYIQSLTIISET